MSVFGGEFARLIGHIAKALLGEPNKRLSKKGHLRFGSSGSLDVDLQKGTWYSYEDEVGGGVLDLVKREKGLEPREAAEWIREQGFGLDDNPDWRDNRRRHKEEPKLRKEVEATYDYRDEHDNLLYQTVRFILKNPDGSIALTKDGKRQKTFGQRQPDPTAQDGWKWNLQGARLVPYRLAELIDDLAHDRTIFIVEGEKKVDALRHLGVPATCNPMGAGKWPAEFNRLFRGCEVVVLPDNDPQARKKPKKEGEPGELIFHEDGRPRYPGQDHAQAVARGLDGIARWVTVLDLPGLPKKGDVVDWIAAGGTIDDLYHLAETIAIHACEYQTPPTEGRRGTTPKKFQLIALDDIQVSDEPVWLIDGLLPAGPAFHVVWGPPKSLKSFGVMNAYLHVAAGLAYGGREVMQGVIVYVTNEGIRGVKRRIIADRREIGIEGQRVPFYLLPGMPDLGAGEIDTKALISTIELSIPAGTKVRAIVIDTVRRATPGKDENLTKDMSPFIANCGMLAEHFQCTLTAVHHSSRSNNEHSAGTNAIDAAMDAGWRTDRPKGQDCATFTVAIMKDGEEGASWSFRLKPKEIGTNRAGKPIMGCAVVMDRLPDSPDSPPTEAATKSALPKSTTIALRALQEAIDEVGIIPPASNHIPEKTKTVTIDQWRRYAYARGLSTGDGRAKQSAFKRAHERLVTDHIIAVWEGYIWLV